MPDDWSRRELVDSLVSAERRVDFVIPLAQLPRLKSSLASSDGEARGRASFRRSLGAAVADIQVQAGPMLTCQRCLQPIEWPVTSDSQVALVADAAEADRVADGLETYLVENDRVSVRDLVEEELLLALPLVPKCAAGSECARSVESGGRRELDRDPPIDVQTPFAQLGELLKRDQ